MGSWGLSLFVLFERSAWRNGSDDGSWGLSLFVLFEPWPKQVQMLYSSWGLSLFVLFERTGHGCTEKIVLED